MADPKEVEDNGAFPKAIRDELNKTIKKINRRWEVKFNSQGEMSVKESDEKVVINLPAMNLTACKNGEPIKIRIVAKRLNPDAQQ